MRIDIAVGAQDVVQRGDIRFDYFHRQIQIRTRCFWAKRSRDDGRTAAHEFSGDFHDTSTFLQPIAEVIHVGIDVGQEYAIVGIPDRFWNPTSLLSILPWPILKRNDGAR